MLSVGSSVVASLLFGSSLAGFSVGGLVAFVFCAWAKLPFLLLLDAAMYALPFGWLLLRAGCALVHDHIGLPSRSLLAVAFPFGPHFDLGVLEFLATPMVMSVALAVGRRARPPGVLGGAVGLAYLVVRFIVEYASAKSRVPAVGLTASQVVFLICALPFAALVLRPKWVKRC